MNLLAFDTSTEALTVAVSRAGEPARHWRGEGGAKASVALIPAALRLLQEAGLVLRSLDAVVFGSGPGSFTGLRTACSVAQGLAMGAGVPVLPVETLMAVAEQARMRSGAASVLSVLDARMGEVYAAHYLHQTSGWQREGAILLAAPQALQAPEGAWLAGNAFDAHAQRLPAGAGHVPAEPDAAVMLALAPALLAAGQARPAEHALPLYVRDKVAQTTAEREAARAAAAAQARMTP